MKTYNLSVNFSMPITAKNHYAAKCEFLEILEDSINDTLNDFTDRIEIESFEEE